MKVRTQTELVHEILDLVGKRPSGLDDPELDEATELIALGLEEPGFFMELMDQAAARGLVVDRQWLSEAVRSVAHLHAHLPRRTVH